MSNNSSSVIGVVQQEALDTATNLDATTASLRQHEPALRACLAHTTAAMGNSHQADVPELVNVVEAALKALSECADTVASSAHRVRAIEART